MSQDGVGGEVVGVGVSVVVRVWRPDEEVIILGLARDDILGIGRVIACPQSVEFTESGVLAPLRIVDVKVGRADICQSCVNVILEGPPVWQRDAWGSVAVMATIPVRKWVRVVLLRGTGGNGRVT